jgi:hypothetical protein
MVGDLENAARSMMNSPQGLKIIKGLDKYNAAMNTDAGRALIAQLAEGGSEALRHAAVFAAAAPREPGRALLQDLLSSKEGAALIGKVIEVLGV